MNYFEPDPIPDSIRTKRDALRAAGPVARWCDDDRLSAENAAGVSPGGYLAPFGWYVVGTTIGGNGIVVSEDAPTVWFADHTWYHDDGISYQDLVGSGEWVDRPFSREAVASSLFLIASSVADFVDNAAAVDVILQRID